MSSYAFFLFFFFFFNDTATTEIYTLSLHDALPISRSSWSADSCAARCRRSPRSVPMPPASSSAGTGRSEEHTSELQSRPHLVCRLLLEKKKKRHQAYGEHNDNSRLEEGRIETCAHV